MSWDQRLQLTCVIWSAQPIFNALDEANLRSELDPLPPNIKLTHKQVWKSHSSDSAGSTSPPAAHHYSERKQSARDHCAPVPVSLWCRMGPALLWRASHDPFARLGLIFMVNPAPLQKINQDHLSVAGCVLSPESGHFCHFHIGGDQSYSENRELWPAQTIQMSDY